MTQKEQISSLEQRVQVLEQKISKLVRTERNEQSSSDAKPLPNRRQERLAKITSFVDDVMENADRIEKEGGEKTVYFTKENGKISVVGHIKPRGDEKYEIEYPGQRGQPELASPLLELKKRLNNNPEFGTGNKEGGEAV